MQTKVIGIAGGTASGKSSIVALLKHRLGDKAVVLCQDAYYKAFADKTLAERKDINFDHPDVIEWSRLEEDLLRLKSGETIQQPVYDYVQYTRREETKELSARPIILLEGLLILWSPEIRRHMDLKVFVETDDDERLIRRILRDTKERGRSLDSILKQYQNSVKPMHEAFIAPSRRYADIIIPHGVENTEGVNILWQRTLSWLKELEHEQ